MPHFLRVKMYFYHKPISHTSTQQKKDMFSTDSGMLPHSYKCLMWIYIHDFTSLERKGEHADMRDISGKKLIEKVFYYLQVSCFFSDMLFLCCFLWYLKSLPKNFPTRISLYVFTIYKRDVEKLSLYNEIHKNVKQEQKFIDLYARWNSTKTQISRIFLSQ